LADTAASVRDTIVRNYETYAAELKLAGPNWERKPQGGGEGEEAWCARQVAEHIAGAAPFFGNGIAAAIGAQGPQMQRYPFASASDATSVTADAQKAFMGVVSGVTDAQMSMEIDHPRLGKQTLGGILAIVANHYLDHANQLKTLRGG
jgi:hypothetical protein